MSSYHLSADAATDLDEIWDYIADDSTDAADRWIAKLLDTLRLIAKNPRIGHPRPDLGAFEILFWPVGGYLVIYRLRLAQVEIVAVTHGSRDIPRLLVERIRNNQ